MSLFPALERRLVDLVRGLPPQVFARAASATKALYDVDSVSKRGNVPYTPETVSVRPLPDGIVIRAPGWSMRVAEKRGQSAAWGEMVKAAIRAYFRGASR